MRKIRRILSLMLTIAIVITTIPLQVFAGEVKVILTEITTEEERFDDRVYELFEESKLSDMPIVTYEEENGEKESLETEQQGQVRLISVKNDEILNTWRYILRNKTYYSEISEDELIILGDADWLCLETLEKLEEYGMSLRESADYSFLVCVSEYTLDELLELFPTKESISQAYSCYELIGQYLKAGSITKEEASELYQLVESYMTVQEIEDILIDEYHAILPEESGDNEIEKPEVKIMALAAAVEKFTGQIPDLSDYDKAPYSYDFNSQENVNTKTGALSYLNNDVNLPGRNGFDLQINRVYNSDNAFEGIMDYKKCRYYLYDVWLNVKVRFEGESTSSSYRYYGYDWFTFDRLFIPSRVTGRQTELKLEFNDTYIKGEYAPYPDMDACEEIVMSASITSVGSESILEEVFLQSRPIKESPAPRKNYGLGYGWNFSFPSIEVEKAVNYDENGNPYDVYYNRLFTGNGGSLRFSFGKNNKPNGFAEYKVKDIDWEEFDKSKTLQVTNGAEDVTYDRMVKHENGDIWYFKVTRRYSDEPVEFQLTAMQNKFGDTISFYYSENHDMRVPGHYINVIDSVGRLVRIERISGDMIKMFLPDGTSITYHTDGAILSSVIDQADRKTQYETTRSSAKYMFTYEDYGDDVNDNPQYLLKSIIHATGLKTVYTYRLTNFDMGEGGGYRRYLLARRNDTKNNIEIVPSVANDTSYSYSLSKNKKKGVYYISTAQVNRYDVLDTYSYNEKSLLTTQQKTYNKEIKYKAAYTYDEYDLLSKRAETAPLARTDEWTNDSKGNILTALSASNDSALKNATVMTYDSEYSIPLTKTWQLNPSTKVQEEYTLSEDKKVVEWKKVYLLTGSNFTTQTLKEATQYIYDSEYHLTEQRDYLLQSGELTANYRSINFSYDNNNPALPDSFAGAYLTRQWITGVLNDDGSLLMGDGIIENAYKYDMNGRLIETTDPNGNTSRLYYDGVGRIVKTVNPDGTEVHKEYNDSSNWIITTDQSGFQMKYQYNSLGQISEVFDLELNNWISRNYYNSKGLLQEQQSNLGSNVRKQNILYDWTDRPISNICSSNNEILYAETYEYKDSVDYKYSQTKKTVEGGNNSESIITTVYTDILGRVCKEGYGDSGIQYFNLYEYDLVGNKTKSTDARGNSYQYSNDYAGRIITEKNPIGDTKTYTYDALGNLGSSTDYAGSETTYEYDMAGRLLVQSNPFEGNYKSNTIKQYDKNSNVISEKFQNNRMGTSASYSVVNYRYNTMNQMTDIINVNGGYDIWTRYEYDERGNQKVIYKGVLDETNTGALATFYEYDYCNRLTKMTDPMGYSELYEYDISGNLIKKKDRNGQTIDYTYDSLNRLVEEKSDYEVSYCYYSYLNLPYKSITGKIYKYGLNGLLVLEDNGQHRISYVYNNRGNVIKVSEYYLDFSGKICEKRFQDYGYDEAGNQTYFSAEEIVIPEDNLSYGIEKPIISQSYSYDKMNRLINVRSYLKNSDISIDGEFNDVVRYEYDSNSNVKNVYYPRKHTNLPLQVYEYNEANLVKGVTNYNTEGTNLTPFTISTFRYLYQLDGNQISKSSNSHDYANSQYTSYQYDTFGRLVREFNYNGEIRTYSYGRLGNRLKMDVQGSKRVELPEGSEWNELLEGSENYYIEYRYNKNGQLTYSRKAGKEKPSFTLEEHHYRYDMNGNMSEEDIALVQDAWISNVYFYDYNNKLIMAQNIGTHWYSYRAEGTYWYSYRADGYILNRYEKSNSGDINRDRFYWDQGYMYAQDSVKSTVDGIERNGKLQKFVRGVGLQTVLRSDNHMHDGTDVYYYYNGHGDVVDTIDCSTNQLRGELEYDAFGNQMNSSVVDEYNPIRYAGEYYDAATGFIYLRNRFYNPEIGRFINEDPARSGLNWYAYANNNPIKFIDPTGLVGQTILDYYYGQGYTGVLENKDDYAIFYKTDKKGNKAFTYWTIGKSVTFPDTVTGTMNGSMVSFNPNIDWGGPGGGAYIGKPMKNADGRYNVAVGPKVLDANYPDRGKIWPEDFNNMNILVVLEHVRTAEIKIIECYVGDIKAHSYNTYPDGQKVSNLGTASINVENGLVQTGIAYPNSWNAGQSKALSPDDFGGVGVIEFKTDKIDITISDYRLIKVINFN